ncbi:hypothetical protein [Rhodococcus sp. WB9]|uniref:hypothetical protein n=1 Tax=Rhodococcus sp. WB9 TaxID=2594007 RepID=UPI001642634B|nr:hypothetical protein [Rhodococcus sp. WB9]
MDFTQIDEATEAGHDYGAEICDDEAVRLGLLGQIVADDEIQTEALRVPQFR